ncbi:helix-turn-helix domain-containing protein [Dawidia soli]|uniref:AraC family transcriptional regulator n=1 Tax=Dawidia soli TaxID=2782352 RepID=A0AAP2GFV8_9BACT|nr:AraC family transcriptional regulator [Dawidia soli]MBT1685476.1 AraC family transcriptional regulator [Dawidia soli]
MWEEFKHQLSVILVYGGMAQGLFVVLLLNHKSVQKSRANLFLSILLVAMTLSIAQILYLGRFTGYLADNVYALGDPAFFLIAPLLRFYAIELTGRRVAFTPAGLLHFAPFVALVILSLTIGVLRPDGWKTIATGHHRLLHTAFWLLVVIQFSGYLYATHTHWLAHQKLMRQELSNTEDVNIAWVRFFLIVFMLINVFFLFSLFAVIQFDMCRGWLQSATAGVFSLSIFALSFKGILQRDIFNTLPLAEKPIVATTGPTPSLKPDPALITRVRTYMQERKPYLDADLTLSTLSKHIGMSRSQLSQVINDGTGDNFYDFVNQYRVEEVKRLMADPDVQNLSLLGLALEAGFKSKSTFNLIFKRFTGQTPTEYRKDLMPEKV